MPETNSSHESEAPPTGLVLGRFQPLHPGHLMLIDQAMEECGEVVVCIGSAQLADPFTIEQRHQHLDRQLEALYPDKNWRLVDLVDPEPMEIWPEYVKEKCELSGKGLQFYRADKLPHRYEEKLKRLGFNVIYAARQPFFYMFPDGLYREVSSATEIKNVYEELGLAVPYPFIDAEA